MTEMWQRKNSRKFGNENYRLAADATTKEKAHERQEIYKNKGWKCRITKRSGPPYAYKYSLWVKRK